MLTLPADVLFLICEELSRKDDFNTLFNCALSSKTLIGPALLWLYRIHHRSSIISSEGNDATFDHLKTFESRQSAQERTFLMWALQWKSIIRSSLGRTAYPYCLYIRSLDLRALKDLLDDPLFQKVAINGFFANDMAEFLPAQETPMKQKMRGAKKAYKRLDSPKILELVGESITKFISDSASQNRATVTMEELAGEIPADALLTWTKRLSNLRSLTLWDASVLDENIGLAIAQGCFYFDDLTFFDCRGPDPDHGLASFLGALTRNTLRTFTALSAGSIGPETLLALNHHSKSLKKLKLDGLKSDAIRNLSYLQDCDALDTLEIADSEGAVNLEAKENDIFLEVIGWLGRCSSLRELSLKNMISGPAILTQVCLNNNVRLKELQVYGYMLLSSQDFHKALTHQTCLESLTLMADPEGGFKDDIDTLVSSLAQLKDLKALKLLLISDYFRTSEVLNLVSHLRNLRELSFSGYDVTDDIWHAMATLHNLNTLNIQALTSFSFDGILAYISALRDTNRGLTLSVMNQKTEDPLTEQEQSIIREAIAAKVDGKFDFTLYREADSEDDSLSD